MAKRGDTVTDANGVNWRFSGGGWYAQNTVGSVKDGQKYSGSGAPTGGSAPATATAPGAGPYQDALNAIGGANAGMLGSGLTAMAGGDPAIQKGFEGGTQIGAALFAPGSLGRVDETASPEQTSINTTLQNRAAPWIDPNLQSTVDRAEAAANEAQTMDPALREVIELRRAALGGLSTEQLLATKEMAQAGYNQSLTSAVRALRVGQGGTGPRGAASNIGTIPLTAQYANSQAGLSRQLILDQYSAQKDARDAFSGDVQSIVGQTQSNRLAANAAAGTAATTAVNDRATRFNNYIGYNTALRSDLLGRQLQNLNTIAAEKSGQAASIFGGGSFAAQQEGQKKSFELGKENLELQKEIFNNTPGGGGGGGSEAASPGEGDSDVFG